MKISRADQEDLLATLRLLRKRQLAERVVDGELQWLEVRCACGSCQGKSFEVVRYAVPAGSVVTIPPRVYAPGHSQKVMAIAARCAKAGYRSLGSSVV